MAKKFKFFLLVTLACIIIAIALQYYLKTKSISTLDLYRCDDIAWHKSPEEIHGCMNHVFPTREQAIAYFNNNTFVQPMTEVNYSAEYFNSNGRYTSINFGDAALPWGAVSTDQGLWWIREAILPIQSKNELKKITVQTLCTRSAFWSTTQDENPDKGDLWCEIIWDLDGNLGSPKERLQKIAAGDVYGMKNITDKFEIQLHVQDYIKPSPGMKIPPEELMRLILLKQKENESKFVKTQ